MYIQYIPTYHVSLARNLGILSADSLNCLPFPLRPLPLVWAPCEWPGNDLLTCWVWRVHSRLPAPSTAPEAKPIWPWGGKAQGDTLPISSLGLSADSSPPLSTTLQPSPAPLQDPSKMAERSGDGGFSFSVTIWNIHLS